MLPSAHKLRVGGRGTSWARVSLRGNFSLPRHRGGGPFAGQHCKLDPEEPAAAGREGCGRAENEGFGHLEKVSVFGGPGELSEVGDNLRRSGWPKEGEDLCHLWLSIVSCWLQVLYFLRLYSGELVFRRALCAVSGVCGPSRCF